MLLLAACSTDAATSGSATSAPFDAVQQAPRPDGPGSDAAPSPSPPTRPDAPQDPIEPPARPAPAPDVTAPVSCDATTTAAITATVSAQLEAFAMGDLAAAYALTSPFFATMVDDVRFEQIIRTDYPLLLSSRERWTGDCLVRGRRGVLLAGVADAAGRELTLRYDLSLEDVGWRIDGALQLEGITLPRPPVI